MVAEHVIITVHANDHSPKALFSGGGRHVARKSLSQQRLCKELGYLAHKQACPPISRPRIGPFQGEIVLVTVPESAQRCVQAVYDRFLTFSSVRQVFRTACEWHCQNFHPGSAKFWQLTETTAEIPMVLLDRPFKKFFEGIAKWGLESVIQLVFIIAHYVRSRGRPRRRICGSGGTLNI